MASILSGGAVFSSCNSLTSVTLGGSVTEIGGWAFATCNNLTSIVFQGDAPQIGSDISLDVSPNATVTAQPNAIGFGPTFGGLPVVIAEHPVTITKVWIDAERNFILKLDGYNAEVKLLYSPNLQPVFTEISSVLLQGDDEILIKSTATELQGSQGFFRISN